jgi:hypothetical protein
VAVSTRNPPCEQWLAVVEAGAGAGSSFVIIYRGGGFVSGDVAALGCHTHTFAVGFLSSLSVVVHSFVVVVILQPCCSPLSFSSLPIRHHSPASTTNPPHEQWLVRLGAGTQACCLFRRGGRFGGRNVVITEVEPKIRMKH